MSGRQKFESLHDKRAQKVRRKWGNRIGGLVLAVSGDPRLTKAWRIGSVGEERLARFFQRELPKSEIALHDRHIPGFRANIDHVLVAPSGVWVIDAKQPRARKANGHIAATV